MTPFAEALLRRDRPAPGDLPARRFAVYRNNVHAGLADALGARFPVTRALVGEAFFRAAAGDFVELSPPRSPLLFRWGDDFPGFLALFPPARGLPYLPDVARLEAARTEAYHAADAPAFAPGDMAALGAEELAAMRLRLHPAARLVRSHFPIVAIWQAHQRAEGPGPLDVGRAEAALVVRPVAEVRVVALPPGGAVLLEVLGRSGSLLRGVEAASALPGFDLAATLRALAPALAAPKKGRAA